MEKKKKRGFGLYGWILIIASAMAMFVGALTGAGMNMIIPQFELLYGWDPLQLLSFSLPVGIITAGVAVLFSVYVIKPNKGKKAFIIAYLIMIAGVLFWGSVETEWQFLLAEAMVSAGSGAAFGYGAQILLGNWFPRKKGVVISLISIGSNLGAMAILSTLGNIWSFAPTKVGFMVIAAIAAIPLAIFAFFVKEKPESQGLFPDNDSSATPEVVANEEEKDVKIKKTIPFSFKELAKSRTLWMITISSGAWMMISTALLSIAVASCIAHGQSKDFAMSIVMTTAFSAIPISIIGGLIDTKFGTIKLGILSGILGTAALLCFLFGSASTTIVYIGAALFGGFSGTSRNTFNSMLITKYGQYDFSKPLAFASPIKTIIQMLGGFLVAFIMRSTGSYNLMIGIFIVLIIAATVAFVSLGDKCIGRTEEDVNKMLEEK